MSGVTVELCVSRSVRDTARLLEAVHGAAPGDPYVAPAPLRPYTDELEDETGGLRIGVLDRSLIEGVEVAAPCVEAVAKAAKLVESLGHSVDDGSIADVLPIGEGGPDLEDSFLTRWAAGQAATLTQLGMLLGRPITEDDVETLTWDMAVIGHERNGAPLPARRRPPPGAVADGRRLVRDRLRPAADADDGRDRPEARRDRHARCPSSPPIAAACRRARSRHSST